MNANNDGTNHLMHPYKFFSSLCKQLSTWITVSLNFLQARVTIKANYTYLNYSIRHYVNTQHLIVAVNNQPIWHCSLWYNDRKIILNSLQMTSEVVKYCVNCVRLGDSAIHMLVNRHSSQRTHDIFIRGASRFEKGVCLF